MEYKAALEQTQQSLDQLIQRLLPAEDSPNRHDNQKNATSLQQLCVRQIACFSQWQDSLDERAQELDQQTHDQDQREDDLRQQNDKLTQRSTKLDRQYQLQKQQGSDLHEERRGLDEDLVRNQKTLEQNGTLLKTIQARQQAVEQTKRDASADRQSAEIAERQASEKLKLAEEKLKMAQDLMNQYKKLLEENTRQFLMVPSMGDRPSILARPEKTLSPPGSTRSSFREVHQREPMEPSFSRSSTERRVPESVTPAKRVHPPTEDESAGRDQSIARRHSSHSDAEGRVAQRPSSLPAREQSQDDSMNAFQTPVRPTFAKPPASRSLTSSRRQSKKFERTDDTPDVERFTYAQLLGELDCIEDPDQPDTRTPASQIPQVVRDALEPYLMIYQSTRSSTNLLRPAKSMKCGSQRAASNEAQTSLTSYEACRYGLDMKVPCIHVAPGKKPFLVPVPVLDRQGIMRDDPRYYLPE